MATIQSGSLLLCRCLHDYIQTLEKLSKANFDSMSQQDKANPLATILSEDSYCVNIERNIRSKSNWFDNMDGNLKDGAVAKYLQIMFDNEGERGRYMIPVNNLLSGKTHNEASRMFFETLALDSIKKSLPKNDKGNDKEKIKAKPVAFYGVSTGMSSRQEDVAGTYVSPCIQKSARMIDCSKQLLIIRSPDGIVIHEMYNGGVDMLSLYMRCSTEESGWSRDGIVVHEMFNGGVEMVSLYMRCSMEESRWYCYTRYVQQMSQDAIVVHEMFNGGVEMVSLYMRC
ncbi:sister chromatid cohesion 1 protein 4-like protein [Tanacetum coccineum]